MFKYLYISISSITPIGDRNKYKLEISINMCPTGDKYQSDRSSSICPLRDLNNYESETSISISSIYMSVARPE